MSICSTSLHFNYAKFPPSFSNPGTKIFNNVISSNPPANFSFFRAIKIKRFPTKRFVLSPSLSMQQSMEGLPPKLQEIVKLFQAVDNPLIKFEQILFYGRNLAPLDPKFRKDKNRVPGCLSQIWVGAYLESNTNNVIYEADSDSDFNKGLAALLVKGLSGLPVEDILGVLPDFIGLLGLQQRITTSRNSGFLNTLKLMQSKALQLHTEKEELSDMGGESPVQDSSVDEDYL